MYLENIIDKLDLLPHPEGGYFKETYRSKCTIDTIAGERNIATGIHYLLNGNEKSHLHRIKSDEMWHFYLGSPLRLVLFDEKNKGYREIILSNTIESNTHLQFVVQAGIWMAAEVMDKSSFSLVGCTVSPGFDFTDFEMAKADLLAHLPKEIKEHLTPFILTKKQV